MATSRTRQMTLGDVRALKFEQAALYAVLGVAFIAALLSFFALKWVALLIGVPPWLTWAFPVAIDGVACVASAATIAMHDKPLRVRAYVWSVLGFFLIVSIAGNVLHALQYGTVVAELVPAEAIAAFACLPPLAYAIAVHLYIVLLRHGAMNTQRAPAGGLITTSAPTTARTTTGARPAHAARAQTHAPTRTAPEPERAPAAAPTPALAGTLEVHGVPVRRQNYEACLAVRALYEEAVAAQPDVKPAANRLAEQAGITPDQINPAQVRKWVAAWWATNAPGEVDELPVADSDTLRPAV